MKKILSKIHMFKRNQLRKRSISILGYLLFVIFILPNLSNSVNSKVHTSEYILAKKQNETESYTPKLGMNEASKAFIKRVEKNIKTSIDVRKVSCEKISLNKQESAGKNITEKNNISEEQPVELAKWDKISASSELEPGEFSYKASNAIDHFASTAWAEGKEGVGIGEWIKLEKNKPFTVSALSFLNGYQKNVYRYIENCRIKKILIEFSDGTSEVKDVKDISGEFTQVHLDKTVTTNFVKITILEAYSGNKYQDTCISEINTW